MALQQYHEGRQLCIIMGKIQELNFIILRLRMNFSCNNTNLRKVLHFWVEYSVKLGFFEEIITGVSGYYINVSIVTNSINISIVW